jgi:excisionase family DNA binding protein
MVEFITTGTLAREAAVAAETIRRKIDAGEIAALKTANGYRIISRADADQFLQRRAEQLEQKRAAR